MKSKDLLSEIKDSFNFAETLSKENQNYTNYVLFSVHIQKVILRTNTIFKDARLKDILYFLDG